MEHNLDEKNFKNKEVKQNTVMYLKIDIQFGELDLQNLHFQDF